MTLYWYWVEKINIHHISCIISKLPEAWQPVHSVPYKIVSGVHISTRLHLDPLVNLKWLLYLWNLLGSAVECTKWKRDCRQLSSLFEARKFIKSISVPVVLLMYCPSLQTAHQANRTYPVVLKQHQRQLRLVACTSI